MVDIVDAPVEHREVKLNDPFQHFDRLAARGRNAPQGTRRARRLRVIDVGAVWRLEGYEAGVVCDLDWLPTSRGDLPDLTLSGSIGAEVDPLAVSREAGQIVVGRTGGEAARLAARGGNHMDLVVAFDIGVERNQLAVRRPAGSACYASTHGGGH